MKDYYYIIFVLGGLSFYTLLKKKVVVLPFPQLQFEMPEIDNLYKEIYNRFFSQIETITVSQNLSVPVSMVLSVITQESKLLYKTKENKNVFGDSGKSVGYMQVGKTALADVNKYYGHNFSFDDLSDENVNLIVGSSYLDLCYKSSMKSKSNNPVKLAFKKYNGGIDETDLSFNVLAQVYAEKVYYFYKQYDWLTEGF